MAIDFLKGAAQGIAGKALRKVAGNLPGLLGITGSKSGFSSDTKSLSGHKYDTKSFQFPLDVISSPGLGNQGHYIMFMVNKQSNSKLSFGKEESKSSEGQQNTKKASKERKIPDYLNELTSSGKYAKKKNTSGHKSQVNNNVLTQVDDLSPPIKSKRSGGSTVAVQRQATVRMDTAITLYMPQMVAVSYGAQYQDEVVGDAAAAGAKIYDDLMNTDKGGLTIAKEAISKLGKDVGEGMINKGIGLLSAIPGIEGAKDVFFAARGYIKAPKMELFFKGIGKRKFSYTFKMVPKSSAEMQEIRKIVASFKLNMLPEFVDGDRSSRRLTVPNTFDIQYMYNGAENHYLHKISTCVLESMDIKYGGEGKYQTFTADDDGAPPMVTEMTLNFQEMEIITKERVAEGY